MLGTSKNALFPGHNHPLTTGTDDLTPWLSPERQWPSSDISPLFIIVLVYDLIALSVNFIPYHSTKEELFSIWKYFDQSNNNTRSNTFFYQCGLIKTTDYRSGHISVEVAIAHPIYSKHQAKKAGCMFYLSMLFCNN